MKDSHRVELVDRFTRRPGLFSLSYLQLVNYGGWEPGFKEATENFLFLLNDVLDENGDK